MQADDMWFWMSPRIVCKHQRLPMRMYLFGTQIEILQMNPRIASKNQRLIRTDPSRKLTDVLANGSYGNPNAH